MNTETIAGVGIVPLILGLVQAARQAGLPSHFAPLLSVALGIIAGVALQVSTPGVTLTGPLIVQGVVIGLSLGLAASGLFSAVAKWTTPSTLQGLQAMPFFGPAQSSGPNPQQTVSGSSGLVQQSNSVPVPGNPPMPPPTP